MKEFPTTDDIWFSFCAVINNTKIVRVFDWKEISGKLFKDVIRKYRFKDVPELYSINKDSSIGNNIKNLAKIRKMFKDMNIEVNYLKVNNRNSYFKNTRPKLTYSILNRAKNNLY